MGLHVTCEVDLAEVDIDDLAVNIKSSISDTLIVRLIKEIEEQVGDWDFTHELIETLLPTLKESPRYEHNPDLIDQFLAAGRDESGADDGSKDVPDHDAAEDDSEDEEDSDESVIEALNDENDMMRRALMAISNFSCTRVQNGNCCYEQHDKPESLYCAACIAEKTLEILKPEESPSEAANT